jgi:hypothetical protein
VCLPDIYILCVFSVKDWVILNFCEGRGDLRACFLFSFGGGGVSPPQLLNSFFELMYFQISAFALRVLDRAWSSSLFSHS